VTWLDAREFCKRLSALPEEKAAGRTYRLPTEAEWEFAQRGGLSGAPLHPLSVKLISQLRAELGAAFPIIGVGGIVTGTLARETLRAGANLLQVYTGFAYRGPALLEEIMRALPA